MRAGAFTVFAVQFRYDAEPEPMELDRRDWQQRAVELIHQLGAASECNKSWPSLRLWLDPIGLLGGVDQQKVQCISGLAVTTDQRVLLDTAKWFAG